MQKEETNDLYLAALNIVTDVKYKDNKEEISSKFLKWIIVKNKSDNYMTDFIDIKSNTKYYNSAMEKGELFIDLNSIISLSAFTVKSKLSLADCNFILEQHKREYEIEKVERRKAVFEIIENYSEVFDEEGKIITETLGKYGYDEIEKDEAIDLIGDSLEIVKKTKVRKR